MSSGEGAKYPGGLLPSNRLMGMCHWMGSPFHEWIDYNGVAFSIELLEWVRIFSGFGGLIIFWQVGILGIKNTGRFAVQKMRVKYVSIHFKMT